VPGELTALGPVAPDGEEMLVPANGGDWWMAWHPPAGTPPAGRTEPMPSASPATATSS
jgi:hypothetical protein